MRRTSIRAGWRASRRWASRPARPRPSRWSSGSSPTSARWAWSGSSHTSWWTRPFISRCRAAWPAPPSRTADRTLGRERDREPHRGTGSRGADDVELATGERDPLGARLESEVEPKLAVAKGSGAIEPDAVIADLDVQRIRPAAQLDGEGDGLGVLAGVRGRLLHRAVCERLDDGRKP